VSCDFWAEASFIMCPSKQHECPNH
jgi:hypothetical protein